MDKQIKALPPLVLPTANFVNGRAFAGDLFQRKQHAERLTGYLDRLREGAVLAIDAPWGEGKTWFGRNWAAYLQEAGHKVVFIDAFEQDYVEDPFLLIAAEIADGLDDSQGSVRGLREKAASVIKAICAADDASTWIEKKLEDHAKEKASFQDFRNELSAFAAIQPKSIVLFIDELDRCQPTFALKLIERLKHFFDVPNLIVVLLINRDQLHQAIRGMHGPDIDAATYLGKFVSFFVALPKGTHDDFLGSNHVAEYVEHVFNRYDFDDSGGPAIFKAFFSWTAAWFNLSVRDIERAVALYAFAYPVDQHNHLLAYVITLKIGKPDLFRRLQNGGDLNAHREALDNLKPIRTRTTVSQPHRYLALLMEWHEAHINGFPMNGDAFALLLREHNHRSGEPLAWRDLRHDELWDAQRKLFQSLAERIDGTN
ncbi:KAP family P-loop NTPase fold protein [Noviherbaspirillum saxi]|nr:P-loop NTPase fold protein [Noviherbaspirillum saxi]